MSGKWRYKEYLGYLGDLCHRFVSRPTAGFETLNNSDTPECGMFSEHIGRTGKASTRSISGVGMHKVDRIAVPRRKWFFGEPHDKQDVQPEGKADFSLSDPKVGPAAAIVKLRDYFAYLFTSVVPARMYESADAKELSMPDNIDVPTPVPILGAPALGSFFREFPQATDVTSSVAGIASEPAASSTVVTPGHSWVDVLPDGSISMRDIWGSAVEMRGGHIYLSASKSIQMLAGDSVVTLAGRDVITKAHNNIDFTATTGQVRVKGENSVFIHSEKAGVQITCPSEFSANTPASGEVTFGEGYDVPGFVVKTGAGASIISNVMSMYLSEAMYITNQDGQDSGQYPVIYRDISGEISTFNDFGAFYRFGHDQKQYAYIGNGGVYATGDLYFDGNGAFRKQLSQNFDSDTSIPTVESQLDPQYPTDTQVDPSYPFKFSDLPSVHFQYRSSRSYGTFKSGASWFESDWQRDLSDELQNWVESPISNSHPYPGNEFYTDAEQYFTYQEANTQPGGSVVNRQQISSTGGTLVGNTWDALKIPGMQSTFQYNNI